MSPRPQLLGDLLASLLLAAVVGLFVGLCGRTAAFDDYNLWGFDFLVTHASHHRAHSEVVIVDFDDATFNRLRQYPVPRSSVAAVISRVAAGSPRIIGLDMFLAEARSPGEDAALKSALTRAGNVVLASQAAAGGIPAVLPLPLFCHAQNPEESSGDCRDQPPGAFGYAAVNLPIDSDGFIRSFFLFAGEPRHGVSFPVMIAQLARGEALQPFNETAVRFLGTTIPTISAPSRRVLIGDWCTTCITHISAISLLDRPDLEPGEMAGKIVLVGQSNDASRDLMLTPRFRPQPENGPRIRLSGVELHALAIDTLLGGSGISVLSPRISWSVIYCVCVLSVWFQVRYSLRSAMIAAAGLIVAVYVAAQAWFGWGGGWFQYTIAIFGVTSGVPAGVAYRFVQERLFRSAAMREREQIMGLFSRYVSPEAARQIWERRDELVLAGQERTATVLFSDIRSFTALTAGKASSDVLRWLNEYLTVMDDVIRANGGFLNKFIGDGLMVLFGVPLSDGETVDARRAMRCAVQMLERVEQLNGLNQNDPNAAPIRIGIGLHTGKLTCGNIGSRHRVEYSVIGETVNLASRLESLTKECGADIVMSAVTYAAVSEEFPALCDLGEAAVRGFQGPIRLYGLRPGHHPAAIERSSPEAVI